MVWISVSSLLRRRCCRAPPRLLQVFCDDVLRSYEARFGGSGGGHGVVYERAAPTTPARVAGELLLAVVGGLAFLVLRAALGWVGIWEPLCGGLGGRACDVLLGATVYTACRVRLASLAAASFFLGSVRGYMATVYDARRLELVRARTLPFAVQAGDFQNYFRPRCMQLLELRSIASGRRLVLVHVHANALGGDAARRAQVGEALSLGAAAAAPGAGGGGADVLVLGDCNAEESDGTVTQAPGYGFTDAWAAHGGGGNGATWSPRNPLTHSLLLAAEHRCDYIFARLGPGRQLLSCRVVMDTAPFTSDHFGVLVHVGDDDDVSRAAAAAVVVPAAQARCAEQLVVVDTLL